MKHVFDIQPDLNKQDSKGLFQDGSHDSAVAALAGHRVCLEQEMAAGGTARFGAFSLTND